MDMISKIISWLDSIINEPTTLIFICLILLLFLTLLLYNTKRFIISYINLPRLIIKISSFNNFNTRKESFEKFFNDEFDEFSDNLEEYNGKLFLIQSLDSISFEIWNPAILKSYVFPAGATLLTGLGVLGTFIGLLYGLNNLNLEDSGQIEQSIKKMANGASIAFVTSVFGVACSLILTFFEKIYFTTLKKKFLTLQHIVSKKFPPLPLGEIFLDLNNESRESRDILSGLAEQIGKNTQTSFDTFTQKLLDGFSASLTESSRQISNAISERLADTLKSSLAPAIDSISKASVELAEKQAKGSEEALGSLIEEFSGRLNAEGDNQRDALQAASREMRDSMSSFAANMEHLILSLQTQNDIFSQKQSQQIDRLEQSFINLQSENIHNMEKAKENMFSLVSDFKDDVRTELSLQAEQMGNVSAEFGSTMKKMGERMDGFFASLHEAQDIITTSQEEHARRVSNQMENVFNKQSAAMTDIENMISKHISATKAILDQGESLQNHISLENEKIKEIADILGNTNSSLEFASAKMENYGESIKLGMENHGKSLEKTASTVQHATKIQENISKEMHLLFDNLGQIQSTISIVANQMNSASATIGESMSSFAGNMEQLISSLQNQNKNFSERHSKQIDKLEQSFTELQNVNVQNMEKAREHIISLISDFKDNVSVELSLQAEQMSKVSSEFGTIMKHMGERMDGFFASLHEVQCIMTSSQEEQAKYVSYQMEKVFNQQSTSLTNIEEMITKYIGSTQAILDQGESLQDHIALENEKIKMIADVLGNTNSSLEFACVKMENYGENIKLGMENHGRSLEKTASTVQQAIKVQENISKEMHLLFNNFDQLQLTVSSVASQMDASSTTAAETYKQLSIHYQGLQNKLQDHITKISESINSQYENFNELMTSQITALDEQMTEILEKFAEHITAHVNTRMDQWNEQTASFCSTMVNTAQALADVVDTLDNPNKR